MNLGARSCYCKLLISKPTWHWASERVALNHEAQMAQRLNRTVAPTVVLPSVNAATGIDLLKKLIGKALDLKAKPDLAESDLQAWRAIARDYLVRAFGSESPNVNATLSARGDGGVYANMSDEEFRDYLQGGLTNKIKILESCIEQLQTDLDLHSSKVESSASIESASSSRKVFVVHGHNHGHKDATARFLERLELEPIVLHERPNAGRTVIEKFSDYADEASRRGRSQMPR